MFRFTKSAKFGLAAMTAVIAVSWFGTVAHAAAPPRHTPPKLPAKLAALRLHPKQKGHDGTVRHRRALAVASSQSDGYTPVSIACDNRLAYVYKPWMWGQGSDYNWVGFQIGVFQLGSDLSGGTPVPKGFGQQVFARAYQTRWTNPDSTTSSSTSPWVTGNNVRVPIRELQYDRWGIGLFRIAEYLTWYDSYNRPVRTVAFWPPHVFGLGSNVPMESNACVWTI
jgi:hypothetical protein